MKYIDDPVFVDFVLEKGSVPFIVRGSISCLTNFMFSPMLDVQISGPTYHIRIFGENLKAPNDTIKINVRELVDERVFPGEIKLTELTERGISIALHELELWADFLCFAIGNPKIVVEVQRPISAFIGSQNYNLENQSFQRWGHLINQYSRLVPGERKKLTKVLWWYRKACSNDYYSVFDGYTAYWNCLEILCNVSGSKTNQGEKIDKQIKDYLKNKKEITAGHILHCYNNFVTFSIKEQMKDALKSKMGDEQASQVIYQCFEIKPEKDRLYQIRNDINHGNIQENSPDYEMISYREMLLASIVRMLIHQMFGHPITTKINVNELAEKFKHVDEIVTKPQANRTKAQPR